MLLILFMAIAALANEIADGDNGFTKVNSFLPSHELSPGEVAGALNKRFEDGRAWPRWNVNCQGWGRPGTNLVGSVSFPSGASYEVTVSAFVVGQRYRYVMGNAAGIATGGTSIVPTGSVATGDGNVQQHGSFIATQATYKVFGASATASLAVTTEIVRVGNVCAFARFNDVYGEDHLVLVTDEWRDFAGGDGGRGRGWRIRAGMTPIEIPLNGHDVFGPARLVPTYNGLQLLRGQDERHYFLAGSVTSASDYITLNSVPNWSNGEQVLFVALGTETLADGTTDSTVDSYILGVNANTLYYVKNISGAATGKQRVELYTDAALTTKLDLGTAVGRFYLERKAASPGFYGNGCPTLVMQPDGTGLTAFEVGFTGAATSVAITTTAASTDVVSAPNHRLVPGDAFRASGVTGLDPTITYYARVLSPDTLQAYDTADHALAGGATGRQDLTTDAQTGTLTKAGASGLPIPPAREGCYTANNRSVLVNGRNNVAISDALDPLHYTPFSASLTAALGESDAVIGVTPAGQDSILFVKEGVVLSLNNFSQGPNAWTLTEVTREWGGVAALGITRKGADVWILSRKGVCVIAQTMFGNPVAKAGPPVSREMKRYLDQVLWTQAAGAAEATFDNKFLLALPLKGTTRGQNNAVLVYNDLTEGWDGLWQSDDLKAFQFARHKAFGEERLCFCNYDSEVCYFGDGFRDRGAAIADELESRMYAGEGLPTVLRMKRKLWLAGLVTWETLGPSLTVTAKAPGYNATQALLTDKTYDPTAYLAARNEAYDPEQSGVDVSSATEWDEENQNNGGYPEDSVVYVLRGRSRHYYIQTAEAAAGVPGHSGSTWVRVHAFSDPWREDYSLAAGELFDGALDVHQNISESVRMRVDSWGVALVIANAQGSARVQSISVSGRMVAGNPSRMS